ncbi:phage tail tape measure protein [Streptomyces sp. NPDC059883]|uniref:phage tail tape measure protein n=1 Tax=unclassified Streptomyces TaxID=2593676 RepID=UPI003663557B
MPRAGAVWVDVLPNMSGFASQLGREIGEPVAQASARAGAQGGESLMGGMKAKMMAGALAAGVGVGALVVKGLEQSIEKQKATGKLKAQLDLSAKDAQRAGAAAGKLFTDTVTGTVEEGAAAVRAIMASGLAPEKATTKQLAAIATRAQDLSTLFEVDLAQGANAAGQAVKTGLAKNATEAFDTLTRGFQVMGPRADDLADTFNEYSTIFRSLGLPIKTVTGLLTQGMKAGARDTDTLGDALKEFQIRATDGSTTSAAGFKALGLDAKTTTAQIAAGGRGAASGLQDVLDRLRKMKDPVDRNAAAVALFGAKAEDLAGALFALDPSKAEADLGRVGGAAKRAGDDLRKDAGTSFEQFKRRALMTIGDATAKYALPPLMKFAGFLNRDVLPAVKATAGWFDRSLVPAVKAVAAGFMDGVAWVREYGIWFAPLAIAIGGVTLALSANAIATGISLGVLGAYSIAVRGITAVTRAWAAVQAAFNTVMALNPVTLVVIGLVALGAALVIAYKKSETFRTIVQSAWQGIQAGWSFMWNSILKPGFGYLMTGLKAIGAAAMWLWNSAISPALSFISTGVRIVATVIGVTLYVAFKLLATTAMWLWNTALKPVFSAIGTAALWLWNNAFKPAWAGIVSGATLLWSGVSVVFGYLMTGIRTVASWVRWLYNAAVKPVVGWIVAGFNLAWSGVKTVFGYLTAGLKTAGDWFTWLWNNAVRPALNGIKTVVSTVYESGIRPVFDRLKSAIGLVSVAFDTARKAIKLAWDKVKGIAKAPVAFIVNTVYNRGIVGTWNKVAEVFGAPTLDTVKGFARGGVLPGSSSFRQGDDQLVPMRRGEGVYVSEAMRDPYERARLHAVNSAAMRGQSLDRFRDGQGFAKGGIFDWVKSTASKGVDLAKSGVNWLKDGVKASAEAGLNSIVTPLINKISGSASVYKDMVTGIPKKMLSTIFDFSGKADTEMEKAGIGGKGFTSALSWARTQAGLPYQWAGNGNPSWDCSGFLSAIESVIRGHKPHRRWATGAFSGATAPPGWVLNARSPYQIGITNAGVGHTAGTINGTNVESRGGDGVLVGSRARSYMDPLFTHRYGLRGFADGGRPRSGELAWVGERGPELVRFRGGEDVYDTRTSMAMAARLGSMRGFAKGTKVTKAGQARKEIPADLVNFTKSLTGSAAEIAKAAKALTDDLKDAGGAGKSLAVSTAKASARLQTMAKQRDAIGSKIATAKAAAGDQQKAAADFLGLSNLSDVTSIGGLISGMQGKQNTAEAFQKQIALMSKKGLDQGLIQQLVAMGPDSALAGMVSGASAAQVKQLNALAKSGMKLSSSYGNTMADAMYDAGSAASKGFLAGLMADEKNIQAAMAKIGAGAVKAIRSKKGLDAHSPSRKGAQAGKDLGAGLVAGMAASGPALTTAAERLAEAALPRKSVVPVTSGRTAASGTDLLDGLSVAIVLPDGSQLDGYVDTRVNAGLSTVRQRKRAGARGR